MKRCESCQAILGEQTPEGFKIRLENHAEEFLIGVLQIKCECGMVNYIKEDK